MLLCLKPHCRSSRVKDSTADANLVVSASKVHENARNRRASTTRGSNVQTRARIQNLLSILEQVNVAISDLDENSAICSTENGRTSSQGVHKRRRQELQAFCRSDNTRTATPACYSTCTRIHDNIFRHFSLEDVSELLSLDFTDLLLQIARLCASFLVCKAHRPALFTNIGVAGGAAVCSELR
jgi:hypothetical protein